MVHWGLYWNWMIKNGYDPKPTCSKFGLSEIDSLKMFKKRMQLSISQPCLEIPGYKLKAILMDYDTLSVVHQGGSYIIPIEKKTCNYGGFYYFFHCPTCNVRMRKLYCIEGVYCCRKCAGLGYYSQKLRPSERALFNQLKIIKFLKKRGGSLKRKPPWMKQYTFQKLKRKHNEYNKLYRKALSKELLQWFGSDALL